MGVTYFELDWKVFSTPRVMPSMLRGCWLDEGGGWVGVTYFELFSIPRVTSSMLRGCWVGEGGWVLHTLS